MTYTDPKSASDLSFDVWCLLFSPQCHQQKTPTSATPTTPYEKTTPRTQRRPGTFNKQISVRLRGDVTRAHERNEVLWTIVRIKTTDKLNQHIFGVFMFTDSREQAWTAPKTCKDPDWKPSKRRRGSRRMVTWKTKKKIKTNLQKEIQKRNCGDQPYLLLF